MSRNGKPKAKPLREVEPGITLYSDGAWRYNHKNTLGKQPGSLAKQPPYKNVTTWSKDDVQELAERRTEARLFREQEREAAKRRGIVAAVMEDGADVSDFDEADEYVAKVLTREVVLTSEVPASARIQGYRTLWTGAKALETEQSRPNQSIVLNISEGGLSRLAGLLRDTGADNCTYHNHDDIVDGEAHELDEEST